MFEHVINALLTGAVICPHTDRPGYEYLADEDNLHEASLFLGRIGKKIVSPTSGGSFFAVHAKPEGVPRAEVSALHKKILGEVRPILSFMDLCMTATRSDAILRSGDQIHASSLLTAISADNKLRSDLQEIITLLHRGVGSTDRERLDALLRRLDQWGYIRIQDAEREIYCVTGMIDVFHDLLEFFIENTPGAREHVEAQAEQGSLF